jgi:hypothetical protein
VAPGEIPELQYLSRGSFINSYSVKRRRWRTSCAINAHRLLHLPLRLNRRNHNQLHHQASVSSAVKLQPEKILLQKSAKAVAARQWEREREARRGWIIGYTPQKHFEHNQPSISRTAGRTSHTRAPLPTNTFYNAAHCLRHHHRRRCCARRLHVCVSSGVVASLGAPLENQ